MKYITNFFKNFLKYCAGVLVEKVLFPFPRKKTCSWNELHLPGEAVKIFSLSFVVPHESLSCKTLSCSYLCSSNLLQLSKKHIEIILLCLLHLNFCNCSGNPAGSCVFKVLGLSYFQLFRERACSGHWIIQTLPCKM